MPARLIIRRPKQFADIFRRYKIVINDIEAATIKRGEDLDFELPAGTYAVEAQIDWCGSKVLMVTLHEGEEVQLEVGSNVANLNFLLRILSAWSSDYLYLRKANYGFPVLTADPQ